MIVRWRENPLGLALLGVTIVLAAAAWTGTPASVEVPWLDPGGLTSRTDALLRVPIGAALVYALFVWGPTIDPLRANYERFSAAYATIGTLLMAVALAGQVFVTAWTRGHRGSPDVFFALVAGSLMLVVGNLMPKVQRNWFVGIRTPWTLSSDVSWRRTHRLGGWMFVANGALVLATAAARPDMSRGAVFATLVPTLLVLTVYSYVVWRAERAGREA
jgi:uncharacterized membrane protein